MGLPGATPYCVSTSLPYLSNSQPHFWHVQPPHNICRRLAGIRIFGALLPHRGQFTFSRLMPQRPVFGQTFLATRKPMRPATAGTTLSNSDSSVIDIPSCHTYHAASRATVRSQTCLRPNLTARATCAAAHRAGITEIVRREVNTAQGRSRRTLWSIIPSRLEQNPP